MRCTLLGTMHLSGGVGGRFRTATKPATARAVACRAVVGCTALCRRQAAVAAADVARWRRRDLNGPAFVVFATTRIRRVFQREKPAWNSILPKAAVCAEPNHRSKLAAMRAIQTIDLPTCIHLSICAHSCKHVPRMLYEQIAVGILMPAGNLQGGYVHTEAKGWRKMDVWTHRCSRSNEKLPTCACTYVLACGCELIACTHECAVGSCFLAKAAD